MMFVADAGTKASTKLTYLSSLQSRLQPTLPLAAFRRGLRRIAATEDLHQSVPATWNEVRDALQFLQPPQRAALHLAWRTASRLDEIQRLNRRQIISIENNEIVIWWGAGTKTSQEDPHKPQLYVVVGKSENKESNNEWTTTVEEIKKMGRHTWLPTKSPLINALKRVNKNLSSHSIKSGALTVAIHVAHERMLSPSLIPLLAKHQSATAALPRSTITYARDKKTLAKLLGTEALTRWL